MIENKEMKPEFRCCVTLESVIFGFINGKINVLLFKRQSEPFIGEWSLLSADLQQGEDLSATCKRVIIENIGFKNIHTYQSKTFGKPNRYPADRIISCSYFAPVRVDEKNISGDNKLWVPVREVGEIAFDHKEIIEAAYDRLKYMLQTQPICFDLLPLKFTLNELQQLYEYAFNVEMDKANFRKKIKNLPLKDLKEKQINVKHRPASLFEFDFKKFETMLRDDQFSFRMY